jgi:hypothetical protein
MKSSKTHPVKVGDIVEIINTKGNRNVKLGMRGVVIKFRSIENSGVIDGITFEELETKKRMTIFFWRLKVVASDSLGNLLRITFMSRIIKDHTTAEDYIYTQIWPLLAEGTQFTHPKMDKVLRIGWSFLTPADQIIVVPIEFKRFSAWTKLPTFIDIREITLCNAENQAKLDTLLTQLSILKL